MQLAKANTGTAKKSGSMQIIFTVRKCEIEVILMHFFFTVQKLKKKRWRESERMTGDGAAIPPYKYCIR